MGGGGVPGPESGDQSNAGGGNIGQSGADSPGPEAANDGVQQNITLSGWPRSIEWREFHEVSTRPQNANEDALIATETMTGQASIARVGGQWLLAELSLDVVVNRDASWVVGSRKSSELKDHEQGHFDIHGMIIGRDVIEELRRLRARSQRRLASQLRQAMRRARRRGQQMTNNYDEDTRHGLERTRQAAWEQAIQNAIDNNTRLRAPS